MTAATVHVLACFAYILSLCAGFPHYTFRSLSGSVGLRQQASGDTSWNVSSVSSVDDFPLQPVDLPFTFPFFDSSHRVVQISPNGGLHFNAFPPCCSGFFCSFYSFGSCTFDTSYRNMLAGVDWCSAHTGGLHGVSVL